jgi:HAD superfamily hydrolase (TIGR01509 family)
VEIARDSNLPSFEQTLDWLHQHGLPETIKTRGDFETFFSDPTHRQQYYPLITQYRGHLEDRGMINDSTGLKIDTKNNFLTFFQERADLIPVQNFLSGIEELANRYDPAAKNFFHEQVLKKYRLNQLGVSGTEGQLQLAEQAYDSVRHQMDAMDLETTKSAPKKEAAEFRDLAESKMPIKAVLFDFDDTLAKMFEWYAKVYAKSVGDMHAQGKSSLSQGEYQHGVHNFGLGPRGFFEKICGTEHVEEAMRIHDNNRNVMAEGHIPDPLEGVETMLDDLTNRGIKFAIVSNASTELTTMRFKKMFPAKYQDTLIIGSAEKPSPDGIQRALTHLDVTPKETVFVGDKFSSDGKAALAAGVHFMHLGHHERDLAEAHLKDQSLAGNATGMDAISRISYADDMVDFHRKLMESLDKKRVLQ